MIKKKKSSPAKIVPPKKQKKPRVSWTEQEVDRLAHMIHLMRKNDPASSILQLINRAQEQFPAERRRAIRTEREATSVIEKVKQISQELYASAEDANNLRSQITILQEQLRNTPRIPSKEEILAELSDEEIAIRFTDRIINHLTLDEILAYFDANSVLESVSTTELVGIVAKRVYGEFMSRESTTKLVGLETLLGKATAQPAPSLPAPQPLSVALNASRSRPLRVTIVGPKYEQFKIIQSAVGPKLQLSYLDQSRRDASSIPSGQDIFIVWTRFVSHANVQAIKKKLGGAKIIYHSGGLDRMAQMLDNLAVTRGEAAISYRS